MKAYVSVDMEGIAAVFTPTQVIPKGDEYQIARKWMTAEVKTVAETLHRLGAERIVIADSHAGMINLLVDELPEYVELLSGFPRETCMVNSIGQGFDFAIFVGYHSKKGEKYSIMDHTISSRVIQRILINDEEVSEFWLNAAVAGYYNVPVIFTTGDDKLVSHARQLIPEIEAVITKFSVGRRAAISKHPKTVASEIRTKLEVAIDKWKNGEIKPFKRDGPLNVVVEVTDSTVGDVAEFIPAIHRSSGNVLTFRSEDIITAYKLIEVITIIGLGVMSLSE
ncbi:MAG: M55 family metallopeptidase [Candidatus Asgardarchaeia archaeon]